jgi:hypothetical protein
MSHQRPLGGKVAVARTAHGLRWYSVAAGLGTSYDIPTNVPLFPVLRVDVPMEQIVHDVVNAVGADMWSRAKKNWPWILGAGFLGAAIVLARRGRTA